VISRVAQHRARRRRRVDPNASLAFAFPEETPCAQSQPSTLPEPAPEAAPAAGLLPSRTPPKIIRFPRTASLPATDELAPAPFSEELALSLAHRGPEVPRILEAPEAEQLELLPSYVSIRLDEDEDEDVSATGRETRKRSETGLQHDMSLPPQPASLRRRLASACIDAAVLLLAAALFALIFTELSEAVLRPRALLLSALAVSISLCVFFQYLFLVYGRGTPGMRGTRLELCSFTGSRPSAFARRCRVLAGVLSGLSLGLGFAWTLVDEDTLSWHDRISGTYLRDSTKHSAVSTQQI
jgi:uncharacterized RDD family membrane protein YckC